jgi:hypothetical protein
MRFSLLPFVIIAFLTASVSEGQERNENPFRAAKVGDYVAYKMTTSVMGKNLEINMKQTVTAKDEKEVTLSTATTFMGNAFPGQESKIDLTKPYDPAEAATANKKGKFEKTGEGKEKIKIGNKEYECTWMTGKVSADANGKKLESDIKAWFSKSVPLTGMIKMEMKSNFADIVMEISESGSSK